MKNFGQYILTGVTLVFIGLATAELVHMKSRQRLGDPGIRTQAIPGESLKVEILLPRDLPGYNTEILTNQEDVLKVLPPDSSFRSIKYTDTNNLVIEVTAVLMGTDRTSLHSPQICLPGQGWEINQTLSSVVHVPIERPVPYELPANRLITSKEYKGADGEVRIYNGVYLYWFVDADEITPSAAQWKAWLTPRDILLHGVLDRWAYITCFANCPQGQEEQTFGQMKQLLGEMLPQFQLVPHAPK